MFVFDLNKSRSNERKHGIDFVRVQILWDDPYMIESSARSDDEARRAVTGVVEGKLWTAIVTKRGGAIRIISVRRARKHETEIYFSGRI